MARRHIGGDGWIIDLIAKRNHQRAALSVLNLYGHMQKPVSNAHVLNGAARMSLW
jgi:hypothetical protein